MNTKLTAEEKDIFLDIYEDLAREHGWPICYTSREAAKERVPFSSPIVLNVEHFGKDHPKFHLIAKLFREEPTHSVDCHNRQDWWTAFVHMLDDSKQSLNKNDRKELYQDLKCLIGHRLSREEY